MKLLIKTEELDNYKSRDKIPLECEICNKVFLIEKHHLQSAIKGISHSYGKFCSKKCLTQYNDKRLVVSCKKCGMTFKRKQNLIKKVKNVFCSSSCAAIYNNSHRQIKRSGWKRSKLEKWLEIKLTELYPQLKINYCQKDAIGSELDIYIPSLKLAFELNGVFHYEPIYGQDKLRQIQNNDDRKFQACLEREIELCIIDSSKLSYFKEKNAQPFLDIITNIINNKLI